MNSNKNEPELIVRTESCVVWKLDDTDGEPVYHIDLGQCIVRYFSEEWAEFREFAALEFDDSKTDENGVFAQT